ncbi:MAG TPA: fatty acid desaturase, partial [Candidatus Krumholzibacteria bacterium]|nr:fatty acid desaturase [Candidatus Krumholzibacteria bacterium]
MTQPKAPSTIVGWQQTLAKYRRPHHGRSIWQVINTVGPYLALWVFMILSYKISYWLTLALVPLAAAFLMRSFIIAHDCGHGAFFRSRTANTIVGTVTSL